MVAVHRSYTGVVVGNLVGYPLTHGRGEYRGYRGRDTWILQRMMNHGMKGYSEEQWAMHGMDALRRMVYCTAQECGSLYLHRQEHQPSQINLSSINLPHRLPLFLGLVFSSETKPVKISPFVLYNKSPICDTLLPTNTTQGRAQGQRCGRHGRPPPAKLAPA